MGRGSHGRMGRGHGAAADEHPSLRQRDDHHGHRRAGRHTYAHARAHARVPMPVPMPVPEPEPEPRPAPFSCQASADWEVPFADTGKDAAAEVRSHCARYGIPEEPWPWCNEPQDYESMHEFVCRSYAHGRAPPMGDAAVTSPAAGVAAGSKQVVPALGDTSVPHRSMRLPCGPRVRPLTPERRTLRPLLRLVGGPGPPSWSAAPQDADSPLS